MIHGSAIVSFYVDASSFLIVLILLVMSRRILDRKNTSHRAYYRLCIRMENLCMACMVFHAMYMQTAPWSHTVALISRTVWNLLVMLVALEWGNYVSARLNDNREGVRRLLKILLIPGMAIVVLLVVNLFNGILFTISPSNEMEPKLLYYVYVIVLLGFFLNGVFLVRHFDRKSQRTRFFRLMPIVLPLVLAVIPQYFMPYDLGVLGLALGITMLYISIVTEEHFVDRESGLYNNGYMAYLFDMALAGKNEARSALVMEMNGNLKAGMDILRDILTQDGDVIRMEEKRFLMFSREKSRSTIQYLSSLVEEAVEKYNTEHADDKVHITARCRMRTEGEEAFSFLRAVVDDKEAGDEVRGIVSMISELDRLDKELALAADIQLNMLPMNFPAFPDRKEFDLFASMTPAKEVGGDFYDFFLVDSDHLALVIADVSGKGIPAALFMMVSRTLIKNQMMSGCDPAEALTRVNAQLCERNSSMMFVTVWLALVEISTGKGLVCNAGHENPALHRAGMSYEILRYKHGMFVGVSRAAKFQNREFEMHPGDSLFVYTDGVTEATNTDLEMFQEDRLARTLYEVQDKDPTTQIRHVRETVDRFVDGAPQFDDMTMLCFTYYGTAQADKETEKGSDTGPDEKKEGQ